MDDKKITDLTDLNKNDKIISNSKYMTTSPKSKDRPKSVNRTRNKNYVEAFGKVINNKYLKDEIKIKFQEYLEKLNDNDTKQIAFKELKFLINKYNTKENANIYLPFLLNYNKHTSVSGKEYQIILIGYALSICGFNNIGGSKAMHQINESLSTFLKVK